MKKCNIGGQAVMEGVMMKSPTGIAMAVRRGDGSIITSYKPNNSRVRKGSFWGLPVVRGVVAFIESLVSGMKLTMESAQLYGEDALEEEQPSRFEKWLSDKSGRSINDIAIGVALVLGVLLAVGLFVFLPQLISSLIFGEGHGLWRSLVEGLLRVAIYIGYLLACSGIKEMKRLFMYHGAEHKTISCYEAEEELTPANAIRHTRLHPRCGTNYMFLVMAVSILVLTCIDAVFQFGFKLNIENRLLAFLFRFGVRIVLLPLIAGLSYEVLQGAAKRDNWFTRIIRAPGMGLQLITTKEPTEDMLEVAIAAFRIAVGDKTCADYNNTAPSSVPAASGSGGEAAEPAEASPIEPGKSSEPAV